MLSSRTLDLCRRKAFFLTNTTIAVRDFNKLCATIEDLVSFGKAKLIAYVSSGQGHSQSAGEAYLLQRFGMPERLP